MLKLLIRIVVRTQMSNVISELLFPPHMCIIKFGEEGINQTKVAANCTDTKQKQITSLK